MIKKKVIIIISIVLIFIGGINIYGKVNKEENILEKIPKKQEIVFVQTEIQGDYYYDLVMLANGEIRQAVTPIKNVEGEKPINRKEWWERQWKEEEEERKFRKWEEIIINDELEYCYDPYSEECDIKKEEELLGEIMEDITLYSKVNKDNINKYYNYLKEVDCTRKLKKQKKEIFEKDIKNNVRYTGYIYKEGEYKEIEIAKYENGEKYINTDKSSKKLIKWLEKIMPIEEEIDIEIEQDLVFEKLEKYYYYYYYLVIDKEGNIREYYLEKPKGEDYEEATYEELREAPIIGNIGKNKLKKYYKMLLEVNSKENYAVYTDMEGPMVLTSTYYYSGYNYNGRNNRKPQTVHFITEEEYWGYHYYGIDKDGRRIAHWLKYALPIRYRKLWEMRKDDLYLGSYMF